MNNQLCVRLLLCVGIFVFPIHYLLGQESYSQEGMTVSSRNYTSFTETKTANIEEWKRYNHPDDYQHSEFGKLPKGAPCTNCVEDLSKRTVDERYFIDLDNPSTYYQQKALGDLHLSIDGEFVTIDHSLAAVSDGIYESRFTQEQAGFDTHSQKAYIKTIHGTVYFNNWTASTITNDEEQHLGKLSWENYTIGEDGIYITNAFPGIDAEMIVYRGAIKTNFIIQSNELGTFDYLVFRDVFTGSDNLSVRFEEHAGTQGTGSLSVSSATHPLLQVGEAILFAKDGPKDLARSGEYVLNNNTMDIRVPFSWIDENIDDYALVVDPIVTGTATLAQASITGSRYNASCGFTNSCDYNLTVASPANATITDVSWTFTYSATGLCWLEDGAIRISSAGCISPSVAGYYWFCNAIGGGTCTGTNQTIFSDVSSCMPAPSCSPQNVPFTLRFYRSCYGATGCSNACIGAGSPWTMTITGQTLAYTNTTNPITLSATSVCAGGSVTASTTGQYGVPGYTYNWSFSPTGTPSVGSGSSANITFPTAGTVTLYSIVTDACGNSVTSSRTVTVTPGPTISVNNPSVCAGQSATLTASGATSYTWSPTTGLSGGTGSTVTATPSTTTTYTVTGTTGGCTGTTTSTVTVNPAPTILVNSETICTGQSTSLTASGATSYTWTPAATLSSATGATVTATPATTTTYTVTGTTSGCTGTATSTVTVNPNPVISVNNATICAGQPATLTATGATSYTWTPTATLSSGTGATVTATPGTTTTYTVTGTTGSCTSTATSTVTVNPNPTISVNSATICAGQSATLTATGATSYTWTPTATLSGGTGTTVTATPGSTTTYTVTGTTGTCTNTANSTVTVNPNPTVNVNSTTICAGQSATLTATGATSYSWTPAATLSSGTGTTVTATPATTTTYTITGTTGTCTNTATSTVTVNPNPTVNVNSTTICAGQSATLTATGATSYSWTPAATLSSGTGTTVTATPATTTTYTITGTTGSCTNTATSTVTVNPNPVISVNSATICDGQSATLTATGATSFSCTPAATLSGGTGATVTATPTTTTTYVVTGTDIGSGCTGTANALVTVTPLPTATASNNGPLCQGSTLQLSANGPGGANYSWTGPNGFTSNQQNPVVSTGVTATEEGVYTLVVSAGGCSSTSSTTFSLIPGISSAINPNGPFCANEGLVTLSALNPGGTWSGTGITDPATGTFDPSLAAIGNNAITYSIAGSCGGPTTATVVVLPAPIPSFTASATSGCSPVAVQFVNTTTAINSVTWNFGNGSTGNQQIENQQYISPGCYDITLTTTDNNGCTGTLTENDLICVLAQPDAEFHASTTDQSELNPVFDFVNTSSNAVTYFWDFGDTLTSVQPHPSHTFPSEPGTYTVELVAYNALGCSDTAWLTLRVREELLFFIPNTFTPNGDESNNAFEPVFTSGIDEANFSLVIYNRWGEAVFETHDPSMGWDGTHRGRLVPDGTYVWTLYFKVPNNDKKYEYNGSVNVIR